MTERSDHLQISPEVREAMWRVLEVARTYIETICEGKTTIGQGLEALKSAELTDLLKVKNVLNLLEQERADELGEKIVAAVDAFVSRKTETGESHLTVDARQLEIGNARVIEYLTSVIMAYIQTELTNQEQLARMSSK